MKVKEMIEKLKQMPQEAEISVYLRQSENLLNIDNVRETELKCCDKKVKEVEIIVNCYDFKFNEEENFLCEKEMEEEAREQAIDAEIDRALGK